MDSKKDEIGIYIPLTFAKRMILYVILDLLLANLIILYFHERLSLTTVLAIAGIEIIALAVAFLFWVPRYSQAGAQVRW